MLTIDEIRDISFRRAGRDGYNAADVDGFIDEVTATVEQLLAEKNDCLRKLERAFSAILPVFGQGTAHTALSAHGPDQRNLRVCVRVELIDAYNRTDPGLLDILHMVEEILTARLQQGKVFLRVLLGQRLPRLDGRSAPMHFQSTDRSDDDGHMWFEAGETALHVPELLKADIRSKS